MTKEIDFTSYVEEADYTVKELRHFTDAKIYEMPWTTKGLLLVLTQPVPTTRVEENEIKEFLQDPEITDKPFVLHSRILEKDVYYRHIVVTNGAVLNKLSKESKYKKFGLLPEDEIVVLYSYNTHVSM